MSAPPGMRPSNSAVSFFTLTTEFQEIYLSAIWAGIITMAPTFIYWWAQGKGYLPRLHALRRIEWKVMPWLFAAAFSRCSISLCPTRLGDWAAIEAGGLVAGARSAIARERLCDRLGMGELRRRCGDAKPGAAVWHDPTSPCWSTIAAGRSLPQPIPRGCWW